jgi:hypothetical protein
MDFAPDTVAVAGTITKIDPQRSGNCLKIRNS